MSRGIPWTEAEEARLAELHAAGRSDKQISAEMTGRTTRAVFCRRQFLGLTRKEPSTIEVLTWTEMRARGLSLRAIGREVGRSKDSIRRHLRKHDDRAGQRAK